MSEYGYWILSYVLKENSPEIYSKKGLAIFLRKLKKNLFISVAYHMVEMYFDLKFIYIIFVVELT